MIRLLDILLAFSILILCLPIFFFISMVYLFKDGSIFFSQIRLGKNQKPFLIFKFRTMKVDTKSVGTHLVDKKSITKFGNILRKTKLDELPQLINVFFGDMSFVGPRPCLLNQKKLISERKKRKVFKVRPGITGLAQISGIDMKTPTLLAKTDKKMIKEMSVFNYFYYIFFTIYKFL